VFDDAVRFEMHDGVVTQEPCSPVSPPTGLVRTPWATVTAHQSSSRWASVTTVTELPTSGAVGRPAFAHCDPALLGIDTALAPPVSRGFRLF
jgi:hypothetical protein